MLAQSFARSLRAPLEQLQSDLNQGYTLTDALARLGRWVPSFDQALIEAGEQSGRLDVCFKLLSDYYHEKALLIREVISCSLYPLFLLHFAVFILPFPQFFADGNILAYLTKTFGILIPLYGIVIFGVWACQGRNGLVWRSFMEKVFGFVPILGSARHHLALSRLAAALEALINAGVTIIEAWGLAAAASGSPALVRTVSKWKVPLESGTTPSELVHSCPEQFPEVFSSLYQTGEVSGQLDDSLKRLRILHQEEGSRKMRLVAQWLPRLFYFGIVAVIVFKILSFYNSYFSELNEIMK